jgi:predicted nucleic acid-binding protein
VPVVDASVVVDWVAPDADPAGPARRFLARLVAEEAAVLAPRLLREEVANALLSGVRRQRWSGAEADAAFGLLDRAPIAWVDEPEDLAAAWDLSRRYDEHPIYDLIYVAVAERLGEQLVTADERLLGRLAGRRSVVAVAE